ncbi:MAG: ribonuclease J [Deltaproteobacteria bacterium]|nr:ribonuclease J [Deltaproteobacteria bacterium]
MNWRGWLSNVSNESRTNASPDSGRSPEIVLKLVSLGGLGEIGMNMMVLESGGGSLMVDAGLMFPDEHMLGVDSVIPDTRYVRERRDELLGIVLTHAHEDHIGALPYVLRDFDVPVYGTEFTLEVVREKLREHGLPGSVDLRRIEGGGRITLGPFEVDPIPVPHSIPDGVGLAINSPAGCIIHSGDFKMDDSAFSSGGSDWDRFGYYGDRGVLALLSDSTNVERSGHTLSESRVARTFEEIFSRCEGRIIIAVFASNIRRIQQAAELSIALGRKVAFSGKSMLANVRIAKELGYMNIAPENEITVREVSRFPDREVALITTGSQAEPMAALTLMSLKRHGQIRIRPTDTIILSSRFIPGHERAITEIINLIYRQGAEVIYEDVSEIHASGHAYRDELLKMIELTRPRYFVPIHGEYRHLVKHARLAEKAGIPKERVLVMQNGDCLTIVDGEARISEQIEAGRVFVDGKGVGDVGYPVFRERRNLSRDGIITAVVVLDKKTGELLSDPEVMSRGFILEEHEEDFMENAKRIVIETLEDYRQADVLDRTEFKQDVSRRIRRFVNRVLHRRPVVLCVVMDM